MEWISTKERLPEYYRGILFYCGELNGVRMGGLYRHSHKFISDGDKFNKEDVTHWMPLPEPPK